MKLPETSFRKERAKTAVLTAITELAIAVLVKILDQFLSIIVCQVRRGSVGLVYGGQKFVN